MIRRELHIFLTALMFYTRIPCPKWVDHNPNYISLSTRYFPVIGWIVGGVYASVILISSYVFPPLISIIVGVGVSIFITGAFHEDGFADVCDGFGGGWTKEKILIIMKDSRLGTYGVVGIIFMLSLKISTTYYLFDLFNDPSLFILLIVSSHSHSRMMAVLIIYFQPYAREEEDSKAKPVASGISTTNLIVGLLFGLIPFLIFVTQANVLFSLAIIPMLLITFYLMRYFQKWIGGYTGDCLGATQQVNEVIFLLTISVLWKFT
jgi:adenosylcobinamide-GDP ribazoletransferase